MILINNHYTLPEQMAVQTMNPLVYRDSRVILYDACVV